MSAEQNINAATIYTEADANVLLIDENRSNGDRTYDDFMWNYVGHPRLQAMPELKRWREGFGEVSFDVRDDCGYTENGLIVLIRQSAKLPLNFKEAFIVMTADLEAHEIREWHVAEINMYESYTRSVPDRELILEPLHDHSTETILIDTAHIESGNPRRDELDRRHLERLRRERLAARACILETSQGRWFTHNGHREILTNIYELDTKLKTYYQRLGELAIAKHENTRNSEADAVTIAA
jgi:hypothetical protein